MSSDILSNPLNAFIPEGLDSDECRNLGESIAATVNNLRIDLDSLASLAGSKKLNENLLKRTGLNILAGLTDRAVKDITSQIIEGGKFHEHTALGILATGIAISGEIEIAAQAYMCMQMKKNLQKELSIAYQMANHINSLFALMREIIAITKKTFPAEDPIVLKIKRSSFLLGRALLYIDRAEANFNANTASSVRRANALWAIALKELNAAQRVLGVSAGLIDDITDIIYEEFSREIDLDKKGFGFGSIKATKIFNSDRSDALWVKIRNKVLEKGPVDKRIVLVVAITEHIKALVDLYPIPLLSYLFKFKPGELSLDKSFQVDFKRGVKTSIGSNISDVFPKRYEKGKSGLNTFQIKSNIFANGIINFNVSWALLKISSELIASKIFSGNAWLIKNIKGDMDSALGINKKSDKIEELYTKRILWSAELSGMYSLLSAKETSNIIKASVDNVSRRNAMDAVVSYLENPNYLKKPFTKIGTYLVAGMPQVMAGMAGKRSAEAAMEQFGFLGNMKRVLLRGIKQNVKLINLIDQIDIEKMKMYKEYVRLLNTFKGLNSVTKQVAEALILDPARAIDTFANVAANLSSMAVIVRDIAKCSKGKEGNISALRAAIPPENTLDLETGQFQTGQVLERSENMTKSPAIPIIDTLDTDRNIGDAV